MCNSSTTNKIQLSLWTNLDTARAEILGKSFKLEKGRLTNDQLGAFARKLCVVDIEDSDDLAWLIDFDLHAGGGFITSGLPKNAKIVESPVTLKSMPKKGYISRSNIDIEWRAGTGTYFVIDYDTQWTNGPTLTLKEIRAELIKALRFLDVDISDLQLFGYRSSSSGFIRTKDQLSFDKGGRHIIFFVEDAGDIERFKRVLFDAFTLTGQNYGAASDSGHFLRRGIMDAAAVSPAQPTFAGIPHYKKSGLTNTRDRESLTILGGQQFVMNTRQVRDLTPTEKRKVEKFWTKEEERCSGALLKKRRNWAERMGKELSTQLPKASPERIRQLLEHRWSGNLVGSDVIKLGGRKITISDLLLDPESFDGQTGPDPVEPDYRGGAQTAKVFMNQHNGRPMIHSMAHGGIDYRLWHDARTAIEYISSKASEDASAAAEYTIPLTRLTRSTEVEVFLSKLAKIIGTTKKELASNYKKNLLRNRHHGKAFDNTSESKSTCRPENVNDLAHGAAKKFIAEQECVETDDSGVWRYNGKHFESVSDLYLGNKLRQLLARNGWESDSGLSRVTRESVAALKELTYAPTLLVTRSAKRILNFRNGELHFLNDGGVELRKHAPESGLTSVIDVIYDPTATAPIFQETLEQLFWPPAKDRSTPPTGVDAKRFEDHYRDGAARLRGHLEEILAYLIVPSRWIPAWFAWIGGGHNGKTFLTRVLNKLLHMNTVESDRLSAFSSDKFGMERLIGKTLLVDDDLETNTTIPDGFVKKISESKLLSANRKNRTSIAFENRCALLLLTNNYPRLTDVSAGTRRRVHSLVFPRRFYSLEEVDAISDPEKKKFALLDLADTSLIDRIDAELPGVVNVLANAYQRLVKRGGFSIPPEVKMSNERLIFEGNPLPLFLETQCRKGAHLKIKTSDFARALKKWIESEGLRWTPPNRQIRTMMRHLDVEVILANGGHEHYVGFDVEEEEIDGSTAEVDEGRGESQYVDDWDDQ